MRLSLHYLREKSVYLRSHPTAMRIQSYTDEHLRLRDGAFEAVSGSEPKARRFDLAISSIGKFGGKDDGGLLRQFVSCWTCAPSPCGVCSMDAIPLTKRTQHIRNASQKANDRNSRYGLLISSAGNFRSQCYKFFPNKLHAWSLFRIVVPAPTTY